MEDEEEEEEEERNGRSERPRREALARGVAKNGEDVSRGGGLDSVKQWTVHAEVQQTGHAQYQLRPAGPQRRAGFRYGMPRGPFVPGSRVSREPSSVTTRPPTATRLIDHATESRDPDNITTLLARGLGGGDTSIPRRFGSPPRSCCSWIAVATFVIRSPLPRDSLVLCLLPVLGGLSFFALPAERIRYLLSFGRRNGDEDSFICLGKRSSLLLVCYEGVNDDLKVIDLQLHFPR